MFSQGWVSAGRNAIVPRQAGTDQKVNQIAPGLLASPSKKTATRLCNLHRQLVVEFLLDENNINKKIHECISTLTRKEILGCAAVPSYFVVSMREDRNLHFPQISPPQTKPLFGCPIKSISNQKNTPAL
jgi:hypothetical protein